MLGGILAERALGLLVDVDALERSALARVDRVMQIALSALARTGVTICLAARYERERALVLQRALVGSMFITRAAPLAIPLARATLPPETPLIVLSDDPPAFELLLERDRGLALGRPELVCANITIVGDASVRAALWWLYEERGRAIAS
jgi:hypothetical protein